MTQVRRYPKCKRRFENNGQSVNAQHSSKSQKGGWDKAQVVFAALQVVFAALIPIAIWVGSSWIQHSISEESLAKDYVGIAVSILEKPNDKEHDALRDWAVDLLTKESKPILELKPQQQEELRSRGFGPEELARIESHLGPDEACQFGHRVSALSWRFVVPQ